MIRFLRPALALLLPALALAAPEPAPKKVLRLSLETAIQKALSANFSIEVVRFDPKIAKEDVRRQLGRFDPVFNITIGHNEDALRDVIIDARRYEAQTFNRLDDFSSGIKGVTAWGTEYDLHVGTENQTGAAIFPTDYSTRGAVTLTQPLLRDAGTDANLAQVRIARSNVRVSEWALRKRIIDVITQTNFVYNDLEQAIEDLRVAEHSRELARQLLKDNQARMEIGVKSPLDVTEARAEVAAREEAVILAQRTVLDNENLLKQLVTTDMMEMLDTRVEIEPPPSLQFIANVRAGIADGLDLRPDYRQSLLDLDQQHIRVAYQANQLLPRVDLTGSLALLGYDNRFGASLDGIGHPDETVWSAGVVFSIPLGNRDARGALNQARLAAAKSLVNLQSLEQQVIVDVDNASGQVITSRERIASTGEAHRLAQESLDAGEQRLRAGTSTTFEVLDLQDKLTAVEAAEVRAHSDYNKAIGEYYRQTGTALREHNVVMK